MRKGAINYCVTLIKSELAEFNLQGKRWLFRHDSNNNLHLELACNTVPPKKLLSNLYVTLPRIFFSFIGFLLFERGFFFVFSQSEMKKKN